jgi:predicted permease
MAPKWACRLLRRLAPADRAEEVVGDLEEAHRSRVRAGGRLRAGVGTALEAADMAFALARLRLGRGVSSRRGGSAGAGLPSPGWSGSGVSWLDFKLGLRMLVRYPGLTLVGGLAMAFAIWVGAGTFELVTQVLHPRLPLEGGDRIVGLQLWDASAGRPHRQALHDFARWREQLRSVEDLGAYRTVERNLVTGRSVPQPVEVAEISASAFRVARVAPSLGRALDASDEAAGAPPVAVIGYDVWRTRFAGDSSIVGRTVRLADAPVTVVGVMPEGYAFPVSQSLWVPFRFDVLAHAWGEGPSIRMFGRLGDGVSLGQAQAELATLGRLAAAESPLTHEHLRPQVMPYAKSILNLSGLESAAVVSSNIVLLMLLVLICSNVALLMFARAATRETEIVVRNALGATRRRITAQLFVEALVLGGVAAVVGLAAAGFGLRWAYGTVIAELTDGVRLPFWFRPAVSPATVLYAVVLTLAGAAVAGVMPALKVTRDAGTRLRQGTAGGGFRFGGVWTAIIVAQVAITIPFPLVLFAVRTEARQIEAVDVGFPTERYLSARVELDRDAAAAATGDTSRAAYLALLRDRLVEVERRVMAETGVAGVTFADRLPRMYHPYRLIEMDDGGAAPLRPEWPGYRISSAHVTTDYFDVLGVPVLAGRGFHSGDLAGDARTVVVNESFVERVLGGRNPIGRRFRYMHFEEWPDSRSAVDQPWYEIVGVVRDLGFSYGDFDPKVAGFYHPVETGSVLPVRMAVHVRDGAQTFAPRLRVLAAGVDPGLRLYDVMSLADVDESELRFYDFWFWIVVILGGVALLLSLAGIYAVMSFTVSQRTREIGIRVALGAERKRLVAAVFRRPLLQVAMGTAVGGALIFGLLAGGGVALSVPTIAALLGYLTVMLGVCMIACVVPTRRALRIEPTEALRYDG